MIKNKLKWTPQKEYFDNTGRTYYQMTIGVKSKDNMWGVELWIICYFPEEKKLWFWNETKKEESIRFFCDSWDDANYMAKMIDNNNNIKDL